MQFVYQARFDAEPGEILVTMPDVPMVTTFGAHEAEALARAKDALATALLYLAKHGEPVPAPVTPPGPGLVSVALPLADALKLAVIMAFREAGIGKTQLAQRLGVKEGEARRILDPDHPTKAPTLEAALAALGKRAVMEIADAA